ncbi:hypothetical protein AVEN_150435-1, partial [Araneus ventricosus]
HDEESHSSDTLLIPHTHQFQAPAEYVTEDIICPLKLQIFLFQYDGGWTYKLEISNWSTPYA